MEPHLSRLLQSNEAPSYRTVYEIKHILEKPSNAYLANKLEILRLEQTIHALKVEQERIKGFVKPYNTILAPIRRLAPSVLLEIFFHCLPNQRLPIMDASEAPLLLTHICRSWRNIALSSPRLWSQIIISLPTEMDPVSPDTVNDDDDMASARSQRAGALRFTVTKVWLDRSGDCPLIISIVLLDKMWYNGWNEWMAKIVDEIRLHAERLQSLELAVPFYVYSKIEESFSNARLSSLRVFKLKLEQSFTGGRTLVWKPELAPLTFVKAPKLDTISLLWNKLTLDFNSIPAVWNRLRCLFLHSTVSGEHLHSLLSLCSNLTECRLFISGNENGEIVDGMPPPRTISLPHLQSFIIHDTTINLATAATYKAMHAPALTSVGYIRSYQGYSRGEQVKQEIITAMLSSFCSLLENSPVERFMLMLAFEPSTMVLDILKRLPHIKHIILGQKPLPYRQGDLRPYERLLATPYGYQQSEDSSMNLFELDKLVITNPSDSTTHILPNLEIFEAYGISDDFGDDNAVNMIKSRLSASKSGAISNLKTVKLHFGRPMQRNIKEEILQYANEMGAGPIELELVYRETKAKVYPKHLRPLSSSYGLSKLYGLTWSGTLEYDEFQLSSLTRLAGSHFLDTEDEDDDADEVDETDDDEE